MTLQAGVVIPRGQRVLSAAAAGTMFQDNGGPLLTAAQLQLVYWGSAWGQGPAPSTDDITQAVQALLASSYMSGLAQYRGIGPAALESGVTIVTSDPPNGFSDDNVFGCLQTAIGAGTLPPPANPQRLYVVFLPAGVTSGGNFVGEHTFRPFNGINVHFAWVTNDSRIETVTATFSHELVESCTDPEGNGIVGLPGTCTQPGWCEIADICRGTQLVNGVTVEYYYSEQDQACIAPGATMLALGK